MTVSSTGGSAPSGWTIDTSSTGLSVVGTTSTSFTLQIPGNTGTLARSFAVPVLINSVKIQDLKIKQAGTCSTGVPTSQIVLLGSTATGQLTVPTNGCGDWAAYVGAGSGWLTISSFTTAGDGSGTVNLGATLNKSGSARSATIYINGTAVPVIQGDPVISISASSARRAGAASPDAGLAALQARLKCGTNCGSCIPELKRIVRLRHGGKGRSGSRLIRGEEGEEFGELAW